MIAEKLLGLARAIVTKLQDQRVLRLLDDVEDFSRFLDWSDRLPNLHRASARSASEQQLTLLLVHLKNVKFACLVQTAACRRRRRRRRRRRNARDERSSGEEEEYALQKRAAAERDKRRKKSRSQLECNLAQT